MAETRRAEGDEEEVWSHETARVSRRAWGLLEIEGVRLGGEVRGGWDELFDGGGEGEAVLRRCCRRRKPEHGVHRSRVDAKSARQARQ